MTHLSSVAEGFTKPFNPLLGETYELVTDEFQFISEQVSHHPPITAWHCEAHDKSYQIWSQFEVETKFNGQFLCFTQKYPTYVQIGNEVFKIKTPTLSAHNLIMASPYLDIGDDALVQRIRDEEG